MVEISKSVVEGKSMWFSDSSIAQKIVEGRSLNPYISIVYPSIDVEVVLLYFLPMQDYKGKMLLVNI